MSLLQSGRFIFAFSACVGLGGIGATYMTTGHLWLGLIMVLIGVLAPLPFYWTHLKRARIILVPENFQEGGGVASLPADLWGYLIVVGLTVFLGGYVFLSESAKSENTVLQEEITRLKARQRERHLTDQQKTRLAAWLRPYNQCRGEVSANKNPETVEFAEDFKLVFVNAGWKDVLKGFRETPPIRSGVTVRGNPQYIDLDAFVALLTEWNFEARSEPLPAQETCFLTLWIGDRY